MTEDDIRDDDPKPGHPPAGAGEEAASETIPSPPADAPAARKKPAEHRDHKDHLKIKALKAEIEALKKEVEERAGETAAAREEARDWKDKALRALADADNLRKRVEREKNEFFQFSLSEVLKEFLHIIDNFERALGARDAEGGFREGVELIAKQMLDLVAKRGVAPIERPDGRFDPMVHQALVTEEAEGVDEPMVGEELQKGYLLNGRLLRPTLVKVLMPKKEKD